jgi:hypothetical protein
LGQVDWLPHAKVELRERPVPPSPSDGLRNELAHARRELLACRKDMRAAAAEVRTLEGLDPPRWKLAMLLRFSSRHGASASHSPAAQRLAEAMERTRQAEVEVAGLESELDGLAAGLAPVATVRRAR